MVGGADEEQFRGMIFPVIVGSVLWEEVKGGRNKWKAQVSAIFLY
jgi:hypothetical protein